MTTLAMFSFPPEAKVLEVTPTGVVLELPPTRPSAPPRPLPMPADERHPDWRWRRLQQAGEEFSLNPTGESPSVLDDDLWLRDRILPCWRHADDPLQPRGPEQDAYDGAVGLWMLKRHGIAGSMVDMFPRLLECGVLAGLEPEQYPGMGSAVPVADRVLYERLFFDVREHRSDRNWVRDAVFRPLCVNPARYRLDLLWKMAAYLLPTAEYLDAVQSVSIVTDGTATTASWDRLWRRHVLVLRLSRHLARLGIPEAHLSGITALWLTEPLADEFVDAAWVSFQPPPRKRRARSKTTKFPGAQDSREAPPGKTPSAERPRAAQFSRLPSGVEYERLLEEYRQARAQLELLTPLIEERSLD